MTDWRHLRVSEDGTHHLQDGVAAYAERFDAVLPFHAPGLAPVRRRDEAWHVRPDGSAAYTSRHRQTFGFYGGLAAVEADDGWLHIHPNGEAAYRSRWAWCGNVQQDRVPARDHAGRYRHLRRDGQPVSDSYWRYAGDYREGSAVVQRDDGLHSHVDPEGGILHDRWFLDLDVFHKGLARARDERGWTHVDRRGLPVSPRRFAMVEPFYNGQARVERFDGGLEIVSPTGATLAELRPGRSLFHDLSADLVGYWRTHALAMAVELGLFDALPGPTSHLASRCDLPTDTTSRLPRALWELDAVRPIGADWTSTPRGALLRRDHPQSLADAALEYAGPLAEPWRQLAARLRTPAPSEDLFRAVAEDPARLAAHHRMLGAYAAEDHTPWVEHLPVQPGQIVLDAGGGSGTLARHIAARWPTARVHLLDLPQVAALASPDVHPVGTDLFEPWQLQADLIVLARVLHDWDDALALRILAHARAALRPGGRVAILEMVLSDDTPAGGLCDLHLLAVTGGRERTEGDWRLLLAAAGLSCVDLRRGAGVVSLLVAEVA